MARFTRVGVDGAGWGVAAVGPDLVSELILCYDRCNVSKRAGKALEVISPYGFL